MVSDIQIICNINLWLCCYSYYAHKLSAYIRIDNTNCHATNYHCKSWCQCVLKKKTLRCVRCCVRMHHTHSNLLRTHYVIDWKLHMSTVQMRTLNVDIMSICITDAVRHMCKLLANTSMLADMTPVHLVRSLIVYKWSAYSADIKLIPTSIVGHFRLLSRMFGRYICFNKRRRITTRVRYTTTDNRKSFTVQWCE
jgi:hypothetical protein